MSKWLLGITSERVAELISELVGWQVEMVMTGRYVLREQPRIGGTKPELGSGQKSTSQYTEPESPRAINGDGRPSPRPILNEERSGNG